MNPRQRQSLIYESEEAALAEAGRMFRNLREVRAYVAELVDSDWWAQRWPEVDAIPVGRSRSGRMSGYAVEGAGEIRLASLREPVLLQLKSRRSCEGNPSCQNSCKAIQNFSKYRPLHQRHQRRHQREVTQCSDW